MSYFPIRRPLWRGTAVLAAAAALFAAQAPAATAADGDLPAGLFGTADPQYDGVWRQSIALLAQDTAGYTPAAEAVDWLLDQQCADGSFLSYRADTSLPCGDVTGADSNATALAVQALAAIGGHEDAVSSALAWLTGVQNADGGWSFQPGGASDANSTAVVIGAFAAAGEDPAEVLREDNSPYDALGGFQLGCDAAEEAQRGAFAWQPDEATGELFASELATADAVLAAYGSGLVVDPQAPEAPVPASDCEESGGGGGGGGGEETGGGAATEGTAEGADAESLAPARLGVAGAGAAQLVRALEAGEGVLVSAPEGGEEQPDFGATIRAVLALSAGGHHEARQPAVDWLAEHHGEWADYALSPQSLGMLVLAAHASGLPPEDFGGTDLLGRLNELGPAPDQTPQGEDGTAAGEESGEDEGNGVLLWGLGAGLLLGIALGLWLNARRAKRRRQS